MAKIVNSWNDWDPLKRVIVGLCDNSVIPPEEPATSEKVPVDSEMRGMWGLRPLRTVEVGNACLENLVKALEERGVVVDRPTPLQWNQAIGTPDFRNDSMMTCMPPRDILLTMGNEIMASANSFRCRYFEYLAYWPLMKQYFDEDPDFLWTQAPRPRLTDKSYKHNYYDEKISLEERLVRTANKDFVTTEVEPMWDAADVMRMGKDQFYLNEIGRTIDWKTGYYHHLRLIAQERDFYRKSIQYSINTPFGQTVMPENRKTVLLETLEKYRHVTVNDNMRFIVEIFSKLECEVLNDWFRSDAPTDLVRWTDDLVSLVPDRLYRALRIDEPGGTSAG